MPFEIEIVDSALEELKDIRAFYLRQITEAIDRQLTHQPTAPTQHRKILDVGEASFEFDPPLWELRVGNFRVFYDVDEEWHIVTIRAVREKPPRAMTEEIL